MGLSSCKISPSPFRGRRLRQLIMLSGYKGPTKKGFKKQKAYNFHIRYLDSLSPMMRNTATNTPKKMSPWTMENATARDGNVGPRIRAPKKVEGNLDLWANKRKSDKMEDTSSVNVLQKGSKVCS